VKAKDIPCVISSAIPDTPLNLLGGDNITFTGQNFPHELTDNVFELEFENTAPKTKCTAMKTKTSEFVCLTNRFNIPGDLSKEYTVSVKINGLSVSQSLKFKMKKDVQLSKDLTPNSASPVLKTPVLIQLDKAFPHKLDDITAFSVNATSTKDSSYVRYLNVLSVDDSAKTVRAMFGGAKTGMFQMSIRHKTYGLLDTKGMLLDVSSKVTDYSPKIGSIYGGTMLTITGTNFGKQKTDNPVQISTYGGIGSIDCFVQEIKPTEIKCRVDPQMVAKKDNTDATMIVFLKTSEEAQCLGDTCKYKYTKSVPKVTKMTTEWAKDTGEWDVKIVGTGFKKEATADLQINKISQKLKTHTDTMLVFAITDIKDYN
jgi:hypothetical protein